MGYDLHTHSIYSDGSLRPAELVQKAIERGLLGIALTDHDTVAGVAEAVETARSRNYRLIPGVELTTDLGENEVHVLGYNMDLKNPELLKKLSQVMEARNERARAILRKLNKHRIPLSWEKVTAQTTSSFVGRTHIFKAMEAEGLIEPAHRLNAFDYYLGKNGLAYEPHREISAKEAIRLIRAAGGIPVLAHPGRMGNNRLFSELVQSGLAGIEVYYPTHTPEMVVQFLKAAQRYGLMVTGGSDYHGAFSRTKLGEAQVPELPWEETSGRKPSDNWNI